MHVLFILNTTSATKFACLAILFYFKIKWLGLNISSVLMPLYFGFFKKNNTLKPKLELYFSCTCGIFYEIKDENQSLFLFNLDSNKLPGFLSIKSSQVQIMELTDAATL